MFLSIKKIPIVIFCLLLFLNASRGYPDSSRLIRQTLSPVHLYCEKNPGILFFDKNDRIRGITPGQKVSTATDPTIYNYEAQPYSLKPGQWERLISDKAFGYKNDIEHAQQPVNSEPNLLQKVFSALISFFGSPLGSVLVWIFLLSVAAYIIYRLFLSNDSFLFRRNKKVMKETVPEENLEDITNTDWETLLQNATGKNDLRLAVRYGYMWLLQLLQHYELIHYRIDKTNYEYLTELADSGYKQAFRQMSRQYEYTWYGRFEISETKFGEYISIFNQMKKQISS